MPFWHTPDPIDINDPPRPDWDSWGPQMQARVIREKIGDELDDLLEEMLNEKAGSGD